MTEDDIRLQFALRERDWQTAASPGQKYALLVTRYCRCHFYQWDDRRLALITALEQAAGCQQPPERAAEFQALAR